MNTKWKLVTFGEILTESNIESTNPDVNKRIRVKLNVQGIEKRPETDDIQGATKYYVRKKGQFIYGKQNLFKGAFGVVPDELDGFESSSDLPAFDVNNSCNPKWIYYYLKQGKFYESLVSLSTGTGSRRVQPRRLFQLKIPLPDRIVQDKIISRFEEIEPKKNIFNSKIINNLALLQRLHQSILSEAVQGKLIPQDSNDKPVSELLKKIKAEKEQLIKEKKIKKDKTPPITGEEIPYNLPKGWSWVRLIDLIALEKNAMKRGPFGGSLRKDIFVKKGYLVYEQRHAIHNDFNYEKYYIKPEKYSEMIMFKVEPGDLIISCSGVTLGKISEIPSNAKEGIINQALLKLKLNKKLVQNDFFIALFNSELFQTKIFEKAQGSAIPNMVGVSELKKIVIGLPPLAEQRRIVEIINRLMKLSDELEQNVKENQKNSELLMDAVLREAFKN